MTPRDALAAALVSVVAGSAIDRTDRRDLWFASTDAILTALDAEGWVLVRQVQPCDWDCACNCHSVKAAPDPAPPYDGSMSKPAIDAHSPDPAPLDVEPTFANTGELIHHDLGCRCWPHVSERDALDAIAAVGLAEYRDGKRAAPDPAPLDEAVAAERARIRSGLSALIVHGGYTRMDDEPHYLDRDAVLALLEPQP